MSNPITYEVFMNTVARGARPEFREVALQVNEELKALGPVSHETN